MGALKYEEHNMTSNEIALLAVAVSLISALFAYQSKLDTKSQKYISRRTEFFVLLTDIALKGVQLKSIATDSIFVAMEKNIESDLDVSNRLGLLLDKINNMTALANEISQIKNEFQNKRDGDLHRIEELYADYYEKMKNLDNEVEACQKVHDWIKERPALGAYDERARRGEEDILRVV